MVFVCVCGSFLERLVLLGAQEEHLHRPSGRQNSCDAKRWQDAFLATADEVAACVPAAAEVGGSDEDGVEADDVGAPDTEGEGASLDGPEEAGEGSAEEPAPLSLAGALVVALDAEAAAGVLQAGRARTGTRLLESARAYSRTHPALARSLAC